MLLKETKIKALGFRLFAIIISFVFCFFILELSIRLFFPVSLWNYRDASMDWQLDTRLGWVQKPNLDVTTRTAQGLQVRFQTNQDGLTPATTLRKKNPDVIRIMIFGDSSVVGRAVPQDKTITSQLERLLLSRGTSVEVINAGVEGYSTDQVLIRIYQLVPLYNPDIIAYGFCSNDLGGILVRNDFGLSKPVFVFKESGELEELSPDLKNSKLRTFGSGPRKWLKHFAVYRLFRPQITLFMAKFMVWELQNILGVTQEYYYHPKELERINWKLFTALLKQMEEFARKSGTKVFFYPHPELAEVWDPFIKSIEKKHNLKEGEYERYALENYLQNIAKSNSIAFCPVIDYYVANKGRGPFHLLPYDPHCNPAGYELTAEVISQFLVKAAFIPCNPFNSVETNE